MTKSQVPADTLAAEKVRAERELIELEADYARARFERELARSDKFEIPRIFLWVAIALGCLLPVAAFGFWFADGGILFRLFIAVAIISPFVLLVIFGAVVAIGFASRKTGAHANDELDARLDALDVEIQRRKITLRR